MDVTTLPWQAEVELERHNSLRLPCRARWYAEAGDGAGVAAALRDADARSIEVWILGEGSNVVLPERLEGLVLSVADRRLELLDDDGDKVRLRAGAGLHWDDLVRWCARQALWGVENLALIPGSVGAAPVQNIGAYGQELATCCRRVEVIERSSIRGVSLEADACGFGYRDSRFRRERNAWVVTAVELELHRSGGPQLSYPGVADTLAEVHGLNDPEQASPMDMVEAITALRRRKLPDPKRLPNAGSFFKNPVISAEAFAALQQRHGDLPGTEVTAGVKVSAAWLIERCGWRGFRLGGVGVAAAHALVLVHHGGASGSELKALAAAIAASVRDRFGISLEQEPIELG